MTFPSSHPVSEEMKSRISEQLDLIEKKEGVRILLAAESGSRAWGFASDDSDYDVRFVYERPLSKYLEVRDTQQDTIDCKVNEDLDIVGWDLRKAMGLALRGNITLAEWVNSPIKYECSHDMTLSEAFLKEVAERCFVPNWAGEHYRGLGKHTYMAYLKGKEEGSVLIKKLLYVMRAAAAYDWLLSNKTQPPTEFEKVMENTFLRYPHLRAPMAELVTQKIGLANGEKAYVNIDPDLRWYYTEFLIKNRLPDGPSLSPGGPLPSNEDWVNQMFFEFVTRSDLAV